LYDPLTFKAADALFEAIKNFYPDVDGDPAEHKADINAKEITQYMKAWIIREGGLSAGITKLKDYHWYSVIGRGSDYGQEAQLPHQHAIAFTVEMDKDMMDQAPHGPTVMESARQYMHAAVIATSLAKFIRELGYSARAHIDGNYRVVCPLVARDAGLGEIGRMGILMTPQLGPRVRIGVVTTNMPLVQDVRRDLSYMLKFCHICKKCADVCPSKSIPFDDRKLIDGVRRWQINQERCFTYWCIIGTDCGKCMSDCPFSHPDNLFHRAVRKMIRNSSVFRHFALRMDDFFYGRNPRSFKVPERKED
jgi:reductive dehalogenase